MKTHGTARTLLEDWKRIARATGSSLEQAADFMDWLADMRKLAVAPTTELAVASTTEEKPLSAKGPKGVQ